MEHPDEDMQLLKQNCGYGESKYIPSGDEIWTRQKPMRDAKLEADWLEYQQKIQYEQLLKDTEEDRNLVNAAFQASFISVKPDGTLNQVSLCFYLFLYEKFLLMFLAMSIFHSDIYNLQFLIKNLNEKNEYVLVG